MKLALLFCLFFLVLADASGQVNMIPLAGMNSTRMYQGYGFQKGGTFSLIGLEFELRIKPKTHHTVYATLITGVSYLKNGYYSSTNFSFVGAQFYNSSITDRHMEYVQIPLIARINWQPFPLVEDWKILFGAGISSNLLMNARLSEQYTSVTASNDILAPPITEHYEDSRNVTNLGRQQSMFSRFEVGIVYKRFQFTYRISHSLEDLYYVGIEKNWGVPAKDSEYLQAKSKQGKIVERYTEIAIGFRLLK